MRICDVTQFYSPRSGGVKRYVSEKQRYVERYTLDEHFLIIPGEKTEHVQEGRLHTFTIRSPRIDRTSRYRVLFNTLQVRQVLNEINPNVIESGDPYHLAWSCLKAGRELHVPVTGFYHSHFPEAYLRTVLKYAGRWFRDVGMAYAQDYIVRLYSQFARTFVPSQHLCQLLNDWGISNATLAALGVDVETFQPGPCDLEMREQLGIPAKARMLLYVGRLASEKNIETLLKAFIKLHAQNPDYWLVIVGDGPLRRHLPQVRDTTNALVWRSYVAESALLVRYYRAANLFIHPGVHETFGLVTLESQASGCPVAGIRGTNMDANVMAGIEHWSRVNTPESLAKTVNLMFEQDLSLIGKIAAQRVAERFAWPEVFRRLWGHYRDSIDEFDRQLHLRA